MCGVWGQVRIKRSRLIAGLGILGIAVWRQIHWPLPNFTYFHTDMRLDAILCGCLLALLWPVLEEAAGSLPPFVMLASAVGLFASDAFREQLQGSTDLIRAVLICVLLASTVAAPGRWVSRLLELRPLVLVGRMSYSIYLWQQVFLVATNSPRWQIVPRIAAIACAAWLSYNWIERPLIALSHRSAVGAPRPAESQAGARGRVR